MVLAMAHRDRARERGVRVEWWGMSVAEIRAASSARGGYIWNRLARLWPPYRHYGLTSRPSAYGRRGWSMMLARVVHAARGDVGLRGSSVGLGREPELHRRPVAE